MSYPVNIAGFKNQKIEVEIGFWSGARLMVNGEKAPRGSRRGKMLLTRDDGRQVTASWKPVAMGFDVPQLIVDGMAIVLVEPLEWYKWLWSGLSLVLVINGGMLPVIVGLIALSFNAGVFRSNLSPLLKYLVTAAISLAAAAVSFFATDLIAAAINL